MFRPSYENPTRKMILLVVFSKACVLMQPRCHRIDQMVRLIEMCWDGKWNNHIVDNIINDIRIKHSYACLTNFVYALESWYVGYRARPTTFSLIESIGHHVYFCHNISNLQSESSPVFNDWVIKCINSFSVLLADHLRLNKRSWGCLNRRSGYCLN